MASYERSYGTARAVFGFIESVSKLVIVVGLICAVIGWVNLGDVRSYIVFGAGFIIALLGLFGVAFIQTSRANVDQAEMTRDQLQIARLTYEKSFGAQLPEQGSATTPDNYLKQFGSAP